jgi:hypothetical protein
MEKKRGYRKDRDCGGRTSDLGLWAVNDRKEIVVLTFESKTIQLTGRGFGSLMATA